MFQSAPAVSRFVGAVPNQWKLFWDVPGQVITIQDVSAVSFPELDRHLVC